MTPFELFFTDGPAAKWHARASGDLEHAFPWATLEASAFEAPLVERARWAWTQQSLSEYGTSVSMTQLVEALARACAPIDLISMASHFVTQELEHAELYARLAMRLGGGTPTPFEPSKLGITPSRTDLTPTERANEFIVQLCCVGETFSMPMLAAGLQLTDHPLVRAVLERVVSEESMHGRLGWLYLDWAGDELSLEERTRLGQLASATLSQLARQWPQTERVAAGVPVAQLNRLGWVDPAAWRRRALEVIETSVIAPLAKYGIVASSA